MSFIGSYILGIFPCERKMVAWHFLPVPILTKNHAAQYLISLLKMIAKNLPATKNRIARRTNVLLHTRMYVLADLLATGTSCTISNPIQEDDCKELSATKMRMAR